LKTEFIITSKSEFIVITASESGFYDDYSLGFYDDYSLKSEFMVNFNSGFMSITAFKNESMMIPSLQSEFVMITARSRKGETRNGHRNLKRNLEWSKWSLLK